MSPFIFYIIGALLFQFLPGEEYARFLFEVYATKVRQVYLCAVATDTEYSV